jgi:hypothetical protein
LNKWRQNSEKDKKDTVMLAFLEGKDTEIVLTSLKKNCTFFTQNIQYDQ